MVQGGAALRSQVYWESPRSYCRILVCGGISFPFAIPRLAALGVALTLALDLALALALALALTLALALALALAEAVAVAVAVAEARRRRARGGATAAKLEKTFSVDLFRYLI